MFLIFLATLSIWTPCLSVFGWPSRWLKFCVCVLTFKNKSLISWAFYNSHVTLELFKSTSFIFLGEMTSVVKHYYIFIIRKEKMYIGVEFLQREYREFLKAWISNRQLLILVSFWKKILAFCSKGKEFLWTQSKPSKTLFLCSKYMRTWEKKILNEKFYSLRGLKGKR